MASDDLRIVEPTPAGSGASISFGTGVTAMTPGSQQGLPLVTDDFEAARAEVVERGAPVSEVFHGAAGRFRPEEPSVRLPGRDPQRPERPITCGVQRSGGNGWVLQEVTQRLPGR